MTQAITDKKNIQQIKQDFNNKCVQYKALGDLIRLYLYESLIAHNISFTDIQYRVKTFHSFFSKIKRKKYYVDPYNKIEDICGVRIICTFHEDLIKVTEIINTLFEASQPEDKEKDIKSTLTGYRGVHQIVKLKDQICDSSTFYKKLKGLKAEIQIRTIVQHSWSEISHKLNYKDEDNVPSEFQDLLTKISSNLSIVDYLYTNLRKEKEILKNKLKQKDKSLFDLNQEVNIDTLNTFLDIFYSDRDSNDDIELLFEEIIENKFKFQNIIDKHKLCEQKLLEIEQELLGTTRHSQVAIVRLIISLYYPKYWKNRKKILPLYFDGKNRILIIEKWQKKLKNEII